MVSEGSFRGRRGGGVGVRKETEESGRTVVVCLTRGVDIVLRRMYRFNEGLATILGWEGEKEGASSNDESGFKIAKRTYFI